MPKWAQLLSAQPAGSQQARHSSKPPAQEHKALTTATKSGASPEAMRKMKDWTTLLSESCTRVFTPPRAKKHAQHTSEITREGSQVASELGCDWCHFRNASNLYQVGGS